MIVIMTTPSSTSVMILSFFGMLMINQFSRTPTQLGKLAADLRDPFRSMYADINNNNDQRRIRSLNPSRPSWIVDDDSIEREECFDVRDYASSVVRVSLEEFMQRGEGRAYLPFFQNASATNRQSQQLPNGGFPWLHTEPVVFRNLNGHSGCSAVAIHNYKCGGTTIRRAELPNQKQSSTKSEQGDSRYRLFLEQVKESQTAPTPDNPPIRMFSFVRDPAERFLSAVRQVYHLGRCPRCSQCLNPLKKLRNQTGETDRLITCLFDTMEAERSYLDRHLAPQLYTLYYAQRGHDLELDLMDISHVSKVLEGLGRNTTHGNSNINPGTAKGYDLRSIQLLGDDVVRRICRMYQVDVLFLEKTGLATTLCSNPEYRTDNPWIPDQFS